MKTKLRPQKGADREQSGSGQESGPVQCSFSWEKLVEMKGNKIQFLAGDGYKRLQIVEADEKTRSIHMICELGKITWPLRFDKLEEVHQKVHAGEVALIPYETGSVGSDVGKFHHRLIEIFRLRQTLI